MLAVVSLGARQSSRGESDSLSARCASGYLPSRTDLTDLPVVIGRVIQSCYARVTAMNERLATRHIVRLPAPVVRAVVIALTVGLLVAGLAALSQAKSNPTAASTGNLVAVSWGDRAVSWGDRDADRA